MRPITSPRQTRRRALYGTLKDDPMYAAHAARPELDSTDWAILSPDVPMFRDDLGTTLDGPWALGILTCAAPYAPTIGQPRAGDLLARRIQRVLAIARAYDYSALILGAWGCGAFHHDPARTARDFRAALEGHTGAFALALFAIADWSDERRYLGSFREVFASGVTGPARCQFGRRRTSGWGDGAMGRWPPAPVRRAFRLGESLME